MGQGVSPFEGMGLYALLGQVSSIRHPVRVAVTRTTPKDLGTLLPLEGKDTYVYGIGKFAVRSVDR